MAVDTLDFDVPFLFIYVDDVFTCIPRDKVDCVLQLLNSLDTSVKFTYELEKYSMLPFLDSKVIRINSVLYTDWHIKSYATGRLIHYNSCHSLQQKITYISNFKNRLFTLNHPRFHVDNVTRFRNIAERNGFPKRLVNRMLNTSNSRRPSVRGTCDMDTNMTYYRFPFIPKLSHKIRMILKKVRIKLAFYPLVKMSSLYSTLKQRIDILNRSNVVYRIPCSMCNKCYIGTTKNSLGVRIKQHMNDCKLKNAFLSRTALADQRFKLNHTFDWEKTTILDFELIYKKRLLSEALNIRTHTNTVNYKTDTQSINRMYAGLLST